MLVIVVIDLTEYQGAVKGFMPKYLQKKKNADSIFYPSSAHPPLHSNHGTVCDSIYDLTGKKKDVLNQLGSASA